MAHLSEGFTAELRAVLAAEALSAQRYTYFAQVAEIEGHTEVAQHFTDLAASVACAAHGHLDVLRDATVEGTGPDIGETALNLASSVADALQDAGEAYPRLTAAAHAEGQVDIASWLTTLAALKKSHVTKLDALLSELTGAAAATATATTAPVSGGTDD